MDEATIDKAGFDPFKPYLARVDAIRNSAEIVRYITDSYAKGQGVLFDFFGNADFKESNKQSAFASQGDLGLPTADYCSKPEYADIRADYHVHIANLLKLTGVGEADAKAQADDGLKFETRLAAASLLPVEWRSASCT
jgi:putative endopeptidase